MNSERLQLDETTAQLVERVRIMEASRFWRLRNWWHRLKARIRRSNGAIAPLQVTSQPRTVYDRWRELHEPRAADIARMRGLAAALPHLPQISIVVATYETPQAYLRAMLDSVLAQVYERWELCVADDASRDPSVLATLRHYAARDPRIRVTARSENGHISAASNTALSLASGDYVAFLDHDDVLAPEALLEVAVALGTDPSCDVLYTDEDKIDDSGTWRDPYFKPDWSPESFLARMYVGHLLVCRRALVLEAGGFRSEFDGSQDYDLVLRLSERTGRILHLPAVLYHWRAHPNSTASTGSVKSYATSAAERALRAALERRGERATVHAKTESPGVYDVRFALTGTPRISLIVPTRDHGEDVERCLGAAFARTAYPSLDVTIVDNGSTEPDSLATFERLAAADSRIAILRQPGPFNFSRLINAGVAHAAGDVLLLLNNDTEAVSDGWIEAMLEYAQRPAIGAVGALLLYPDGTVQHAGVVAGLGGVAGHSHKHFPGDAPGYFHALRAIGNYSAVTAACMMVRRDAFERAGGFDESLAVAFNDVDFCLRLREAGFRNVYLPHVVLFHAESKSRGPETQPQAIDRFAREIATMKARWPVLATGDPYYNPNLTLDREDFSLDA